MYPKNSFPLLEVLFNFSKRNRIEEALDYFTQQLAAYFDFKSIEIDSANFRILLSPQKAILNYQGEANNESLGSYTDLSFSNIKVSWFYEQLRPNQTVMEMARLILQSLITELRGNVLFSQQISTNRRAVSAVNLNDKIKYRDVIENLPGQVYILRRDLKDITLIYCTDQHLHTGVASREFIGFQVKDILPSKQLYQCLKSIEKAFQGFVVNLEVKFGTLWFNHMLMPYTSSENGTYTEIIGFAQDITEKRLTKSQLELREQELSEIQNIAKVGNWTWSMNTGQIEWTQSINRIIGLPKELYPESLEDMHALFEEKSAKKLQKAHSLILKKGGMYEEELEIQHSGMSKKMLLANGKVIYDENGSSVGISGTIRDITDLRNIQEHLVSSERRLSAATKGADIGIWEFNIESKLIFMNATTKELLDIKTAASFISYKQILALMPLEDSLRIKQTYFGQTSSQIKFGFSIVSQGKEKMFEVAATLYYARIPEKAKYTGVIIDVTKRKVTENRVSLLNAQVTAILANSPSAIFVKSPNGIIEMMSNAGKEWWGENCEGLADEDILDPSIQEVSRQGDITVLQNQKPVTYEVSYPYQAKTKVLLVTKFPIFYNENEYHVGGVATDITILKQNEVALIEAKEKAEESDRLKSAFLANMSHEIRTPLNSIIGFSDILKRQNLKEEDRLRFLAIINEQGKHLLNIINDIIDLSAIEANKLKLLSQQVDLNKLFDSIYNTFSERIVLLDKKNIDFIIEKELQGQLFVQTDSSRLTQILTNLVNNAIKFTEKGFVKLSYHVKDDTIQFSVRDSGVGISEDHLDTVFERFRQLDQSDTRKHGGTGLGLAITKSLVEIMGGKMAVESQLGYGTIFSCVLPMVAEQKAVNIPKKNLLVPDYTGRNIFVVEDDINSAFLLQTLLGNTKANVTHFILGSDVVKQCKEHPESVDVVLMDLQLPDITGYDATRAILAILPNAKIIAQSAQAMQSHKQKAFDAGCVDYLTKPIDMVKLFDVLRKYE